MAGAERRGSRWRCFGGDHPERLGKDRRDHGGVGEREQVDEMPVLEGAGEERPGRGNRLELSAVVAEADDHRAGVEALEGLEEQVDALVADQLAEVEDRWTV